MKPICTKENPAPQLRDREGYKEWNHKFKHSDSHVTIIWDDLSFVQIYCPNCDSHFGYNKNVFLSKDIPLTYWREGQYEDNKKVYNKEYDI